jgi:hypothetical protein
MPPAAALASERLVMPFDCDVEGGTIHLSPAADTSYAIVGARDEQTVTTCLSDSSTGCRTVMVHRFSISCAGKPVSWIAIAAAIHSATANRAWMEGGRLNLVMPTRGTLDAPDGCIDGRHGDLQRQLVLRGDCLPWPRKAAFDHLVLPDGFAPLGELGARLMIGTAADEAALAAGEATALALEPRLTRVAMNDAEYAIAKADPDAILEPSGRRETFETALEPDLASDEWITVVRAGSEDMPPIVTAEHEPRLWAWLAASGSASVILLLLGIRYIPSLRARANGSSAFRRAHGNLTLANASGAVTALLQQTETAAHELKGAGPLRDVLQGELGQVRDRLANLDRQVAKGDLPDDRSALQFRGLVRDLERIRRIVDSAVASLANTKRAPTLPRTPSEAYEVLGVNAEVSAGVLKKIVDALRMSWHPDLARDESDRALRETRIRQINIAWDLINGKREAA